MNERDRYKRGRQLRQSDISTKQRTVELHNRNETPKHAVMKLLLALALERRGRVWGTEVQIDGGRCDVLDWGPPDGCAVVYEIETDCTPHRKQEKIEQYCSWIVRDVLVLDPTDAPDNLLELWRWIETRVYG